MKIIGTGAFNRRNDGVATRRRASWLLSFAMAGGAAVLINLSVQAQTAPDGGRIVTPPSGIEKPGDVGKRAHTNVEIFVPKGGAGRLRSPSPPAATQPSGAPGGH